MKKLLLFLAGSMLLATPVFSQMIAYSDNFTDGVSTINWFSAWTDAQGNGYTPMVATNEAGPTDDWIGVLTGNLDSLGSLGAALGGDISLADYSIDADVYIELDGGYYNGLMVRADTTDFVRGYQLVANFNSMFGAARLRFRYFSQNQMEIRTLLEVAAADLPGGAPTEDGWYNMQIKAVGNQFWLYWNGQLINEQPIEDPDAALSAGYFGVYTWDALSGGAPTTKVDNVVVSYEGQLTESFTGGMTTLQWFSAWTDNQGNGYTPMVPANEAGPTDNWIGVLTGNLDSLGSLGAALAGNPSWSNYSMGADVYIELGAGYYNGIMIRTDTTDAVRGYQLAANFNSTFGAARLRFRYFSQNQMEIRTLLEVAAADLPGGAPTADGWYNMKIKAVDNQFWLYWNGQLINEEPIEDPDAALSAGYFGVYTWDALSGVAPTTKVDNIVIMPEGIVNSISPITQKNNVAANFKLFDNYPNPFNPETTISFEIVDAGDVNLTVYDLMGREIQTLVNGHRAPGVYSVTWNGTDMHGIPAPSGVYVYRLLQNKLSMSHKMMLLK
ncbi:T9SS type A sorting domain-containing protein [candidate division KSB1 bacterium]|nr:T9SS type A sorting domain-containing protein [candidate division KSB1 bacterium]